MTSASEHGMTRADDDSLEGSTHSINDGILGPFPVVPSQYTKEMKRPQSPFFRPSAPKRVTITQTVTTPNGTQTMIVQRKSLLSSGKIDDENKSSILGAFANLVNAIVGAGIIGIPYAMKECGLAAGLFLIIFVAFLTNKSLNILIQTGKHAKVQSYETLMEAAFGRKGFIFISINMLVMSYGAMVAYLLVIKDTLPFAFGIEPGDIGMKRTILFITSVSILLPLASQRDMADLSKTSSISVVFDIVLVFIVVISSPISSAVEASGGFWEVLSQSMVHKSTLFVGLGVLSFAFVCQDSSFIIAGSLNKPTRKRWSLVTKSTMITSSFLSAFIGCAGYLGFQEDTEGNILNSFIDYPPSGKVFGSLDASFIVNIARWLLGLSMFFVYPMASYVARHVMIVLLFSGRQAHEGNDHTVLARSDRRFGLTFTLYLLAIIPALVFDDIGVVLSATGAIGGSCLSYLGPGMIYLGIHGKIFLEHVSSWWFLRGTWNTLLWHYPANNTPHSRQRGVVESTILIFLWYVTLMPLWCFISEIGRFNFQAHEDDLAQKSPCVVNRLLGITKSNTKNKSADRAKSSDTSSSKRSASFDDILIERSDTEIMNFNERYPLFEKPRLIPPSAQRSPSISSSYGSTAKEVMTIPLEGNKNIFNNDQSIHNEEQDHENARHTGYDFFLAILYIVVGAIAMSAGLFSIAMK